jgi:putative phosphoribosyl transferase
VRRYSHGSSFAPRTYLPRGRRRDPVRAERRIQALVANARVERLGAVVSRGGRPDLAGEALRRVHAPTLLIVGGNDAEVLRLNRQALAALGGEARLEVVPGATHLFDGPGALAPVAALARDWFLRHLARAAEA